MLAWPNPRRWTVGLIALAVTGALTACTEAEPASEPSATPSTAATKTAEPAQLTFGVFGAAEEVEGYDSMVRQFNSLNEDVAQVEVTSWRNREQELNAFREDGLPDVFLLSRADLASYEDAIQPVDELLDSRGVEFSDSYSRDSLEAFSVDNQLACMPYGISPMVLYINTDLVDFEQMTARGLPAPVRNEEGDLPRSWTFDQFSAAAEFATRPRRGTRGLYIEPTLRGLAPFILSGDGPIFDDDKEPTSLDLSDDASQAALGTTLALLRESSLTLTDAQLARRSPLEWFKRGKLGMIAGFRDLTPQLRLEQKLNFDVMPIPDIASGGTVGDITGVCLNKNSGHINEAADFLTWAVSEDSVEMVSRAGYLVPANITISASDAFMEPGRQPSNSQVFYYGMRDIYIPPLITRWNRLDRVIDADLQELVTRPILEPEDIAEITGRIDEASRQVLDPEATPSPSSTTEPDPTESASGENR